MKFVFKLFKTLLIITSFGMFLLFGGETVNPFMRVHDNFGKVRIMDMKASIASYQIKLMGLSYVIYLLYINPSTILSPTPPPPHPPPPRPMHPSSLHSKTTGITIF